MNALIVALSKIFVVIFLLSLILAYFLWYRPKLILPLYESFINADKRRIIFSTNTLQSTLWADSLNIETVSAAYEQSTWIKDAELLQKPQVISLRTESKNEVLMLCDPLDAKHIFTSSDTVSGVKPPKGYFVAIASLGNALKMECGFDIADKTVGYLDRSDYLMIQAIAHGYRIPPEKIHATQIPLRDWDKLGQALNSSLDVIITYIIPGSAFHKLLQTQAISVVGFKDIDINRVRIFYPAVQLEKVKLLDVLLDVPGSALKVKANEQETDVLSMTLAVKRLRKAIKGGGNSTTKEPFITRLKISPESISPAYRCYGDDAVESKALCDSPYDVSGNRKEHRTVWDRPCLRNADCPFYKKNKQYTNSRGGCIKGKCEFPIGLKRVSFRKYDDTGIWKPFCYGCKNPRDPKCCEKQAKAFLSWTNGPDYAFADDTKARQRAGLETSIPIS